METIIGTLWCHKDNDSKVSVPVAPEPPHKLDMAGEYVTLRKLDASRDIAGLYAISHGEGNEHLWRYLLNGPFSSESDMSAWLIQAERSADPLYFTVYDNSSNQPLGMVSFMNIVPPMLRLELGNIWYTPSAQRSNVNTEAMYLMLEHSFEVLGYRRIEWKCDNLNLPSKEAAERLGFQYEGLFRQHMIVRGMNRDTAWFSMLDREWESLRKNFRLWLYSGGKHESLGEMNRATINMIGR